MIRSLLKGCITVSVWGWNLAFIVLTQWIFWLFVIYVSAALTRDHVPLSLLLDVPPSIPLAIITAAALPFVSIGAALRRPDQKGLITRLFYGTQAPILLICLLRIVAFREVTYAVGFMLISILFAALFYAFRLLYPKPQETRESLVSLGLHGVLAALTLYACAIGCVVAPLIGLFCIKGLYDSITHVVKYPGRITEYLLITIPFAAILCFSAVLFVYAPVGCILAYGRAWHESKRRAAWFHPVTRVNLTAYGVPVLWFVTLWALIPDLNRSLLTASGPVALTQAEKKALLAREHDVRQSLTDAYLWRYRYLGDQESCESNKLFGFICPLLKPVLYPGAKNDAPKAADRYTDIFGVSIQEQERESIRAALNATADRDQAEAGVLNINERNVRLEQQDVTTRMQGPFIRTEIHETYRNTTQTAQEIFYYFTLPENAAVTGLWLGSSPDKSRSDAFQIAPRGAAQKVYKASVRNATDPALLEQTGPRQYRLRAFPVLGSAVKGEEGPPVHLWFSYVALPSTEQSAAPQLLQKRNIFWDERTKRTVNGKELVSGSAWIPQAAFPKAKPFTQPFTVEGDSLRITARPAQAVPTDASAPAPVAVLLDSAYPMSGHKRDLLHALSFLRRAGAKPHAILAPVNETPITLPGDERQAERIIDETVFFGPSVPGDLWNRASELQRLRTYSAVFVLTQGGVHAPLSVPATQASQTPVWFIYTDRLPDALDDDVFRRTLASKGGAAVRIEEAYRRLIASRTLPASARLKGSVVWEVAPMSVKARASNPPSFGDTLAYAFAASELDLLPGADLQERMDAAHRVSFFHGVLSPYSSMIVLVTYEQMNALMQAETATDRFDRQEEHGTETFISAQVSAVPEPETWMLLGAGGALLIFLALRGREGRMTPAKTQLITS